MTNDGWKTVLDEPTGAMLDAAFKAWFGADSPFFPSLGSEARDWLRKAYKAMLDASPVQEGDGR